jgi:hypothetical protein
MFPHCSRQHNWQEGLAAKLLKEVVARDGIEPPTPAFSGRKSPNDMSLIRFILVIIIALKTAVLLE